jgi:2-keto-4-pentenoate hydratase
MKLLYDRNAAGSLTMNGKIAGEGAAEDPCSTLAWLANNLAERGRDLNTGGWW